MIIKGLSLQDILEQKTVNVKTVNAFEESVDSILLVGYSGQIRARSK
jgi:hypothetical protein